jgi:hypothetical protein
LVPEFLPVCHPIRRRKASLTDRVNSCVLLRCIRNLAHEPVPDQVFSDLAQSFSYHQLLLRPVFQDLNISWLRASGVVFLISSANFR